MEREYITGRTEALMLETGFRITSMGLADKRTNMGFTLRPISKMEKSSMKITMNRCLRGLKWRLQLIDRIQSTIYTF